MQADGDNKGTESASYIPKTISMDAGTFQKTMIESPEYKFSNIDIDDFFNYIQRQIESEKDIVTDKSE